MKVRKPMRLDENLIKQVEKYGKGDTFTSKMEYILDDYFNTMSKRKSDLKLVQKQIKLAEKDWKGLQLRMSKAKQKFEKCLEGILWG